MGCDFHTTISVSRVEGEAERRLSRQPLSEKCRRIRPRDEGKQVDQQECWWMDEMLSWIRRNTHQLSIAANPEMLGSSADKRDSEQSEQSVLETVRPVISRDSGLSALNSQPVISPIPINSKI